MSAADGEIRHLTAEQLRVYIQGRTEGGYLLYDVRQPGEYAAGHIPGATLLPLGELEARLFALPDDRELVFYCHRGPRSLAAAELVREAEITTQRIYHLDGGMLAWDGRRLSDFPRVDLFAGIEDDAERLYTAMDLEKGAWRFYTHVAARHSGAAWASVFEDLVAAETAHARSLYDLWSRRQPDPPSFEDLFGQLHGEILEGGASLSESLQRIDASGEAACLKLVESALDIECAAFDLYRSLAESQGPASAVGLFRRLAQAEKGHIRRLAQAAGRCPDTRRHR